MGCVPPQTPADGPGNGSPHVPDVLAPQEPRHCRARRRCPLAVPVLLLLLATACSRPLSPPPQPAPADVYEVGIASWYGPGFHGRATASGEIFDQNALTAAHRRLPFGTRVRVVNLENGREVVVRINDRGPALEDRVIDLSRAAAEALGMLQAGIVRVRLILEY